MVVVCVGANGHVCVRAFGLGRKENVNLTGPDVPGEVWELAAVYVLHAQPPTSPLWPKCFLLLVFFYELFFFFFIPRICHGLQSQYRTGSLRVEWMSVQGTLWSSQLCLPLYGKPRPRAELGGHHCRSLCAGQETRVASSADNLPQPLPLPRAFCRGAHRARAAPPP